MWEARRDGLVSTMVGDETVVYDPVRQEVHHLNALSGLVWNAADGHTLPEGILAQAKERLGSAVSAEAVDEALWLLARAGLVTGPEPLMARPDRRRLVRGLAMVPVVLSVTAPAAVAANSTCSSPVDPMANLWFERTMKDPPCQLWVSVLGLCPNTTYSYQVQRSGGVGGGGFSGTITTDGNGWASLAVGEPEYESEESFYQATVAGAASPHVPIVCL